MPTKTQFTYTVPSMNPEGIKPAYISPTGIVTFQDSAGNYIPPNQSQCEAYGYTYNKDKGTCEAFNYFPHEIYKDETSIKVGQDNYTGIGTDNALISGTNNHIEGFSTNSFIIGESNLLNRAVNNSSITGTLGNATAQNSIVLGGNSLADTTGKRQLTFCMYGGQTTGSGTLSSYLNSVSGEYYVVPENAAIYFQADVLAVRIGGSSGSGAVGDFGSWIERGVVINKSGTLSIARERVTVQDSGTTTNWRPTAAVASSNFKINIRGAADMTIDWSISMKLTQLQTSVAL